MTMPAPYVSTAPAPGVPAQRGLGIVILVVTGVIVVRGIFLGVAVASGQAYDSLPGATFPFDAHGGFGVVGFVAWLLVAQWMATAARAARANGYQVKYRPWVAWWGWVIPIWSLWAPYRFMKDATQGFGVRLLGWWWAMWLVGTVTIWSSSGSSTVDGIVTHHRSTTSAPVNAIALTVAWILFARIVLTVSKGSPGIAPTPWQAPADIQTP